jgi:ribose 5-phosphate isomerase B
MEAGTMRPTGETIPIASDHAGFELKQKLSAQLAEMGYTVQDLGAKAETPGDDYPDYAHPLANEVSSGQAKRGILLCGSGIGVDIVANRYPHVRAALSWKPEIAELSRKHNDSNVLVIPARFVSDEEASDIVSKWLTTDFEGGRHARRVNKIDNDDAESASQGDGDAAS